MLSSTVFNPRKKTQVNPKLSLVALMDIFTILVFFLLLNSGEAQKIENAKFVKLPDSKKGDIPHEELIITISDKLIWVEKEEIAKVKDVLKGSEDVIEPLAEKLKEHVEKLGELSTFEKENGLAIIIMGDKETPYVLLKSVMATCRYHNFRNVSLAVNSVAGSSSTTAVPAAEFFQQQQQSQSAGEG